MKGTLLDLIKGTDQHIIEQRYGGLGAEASLDEMNDGDLLVIEADTRAEADAMLLAKGAKHKYIKRVPTGKPKPKYRYIYKMTHGGGLHNHDHYKRGAKFKGKDGHYHIDGVSDDGSITVTHDETGEEQKFKDPAEFADHLKGIHAPEKPEAKKPEAKKEAGHTATYQFKPSVTISTTEEVVADLHRKLFLLGSDAEVHHIDKKDENGIRQFHIEIKGGSPEVIKEVMNNPSIKRYFKADAKKPAAKQQAAGFDEKPEAELLAENDAKHKLLVENLNTALKTFGLDGSGLTAEPYKTGSWFAGVEGSGNIGLWGKDSKTGEKKRVATIMIQGGKASLLDRGKHGHGKERIKGGGSTVSAFVVAAEEAIKATESGRKIGPITAKTNSFDVGGVVTVEEHARHTDRFGTVTTNSTHTHHTKHGDKESISVVTNHPSGKIDHHKSGASHTFKTADEAAAHMQQVADNDREKKAAQEKVAATMPKPPFKKKAGSISIWNGSKADGSAKQVKASHVVGDWAVSGKGVWHIPSGLRANGSADSTLNERVHLAEYFNANVDKVHSSQGGLGDPPSGPAMDAIASAARQYQKDKPSDVSTGHSVKVAEYKQRDGDHLITVKKHHNAYGDVSHHTYEDNKGVKPRPVGAKTLSGMRNHIDDIKNTGGKEYMRVGKPHHSIHRSSEGDQKVETLGTHGDFSIHKNHITGEHVVTHTPTGLALGRQHSLKQAKAQAKHMSEKMAGTDHRYDFGKQPDWKAMADLKTAHDEWLDPPEVKKGLSVADNPEKSFLSALDLVKGNRPHDYIRRTGVKGNYKYVYANGGTHKNAAERRHMTHKYHEQQIKMMGAATGEHGHGVRVIPDGYVRTGRVKHNVEFTHRGTRTVTSKPMTLKDAQAHAAEALTVATMRSSDWAGESYSPKTWKPAAKEPVGGNVIGHTPVRGKAIYASHGGSVKKDHQNFSAAEHLAASEVHRALASQYDAAGHQAMNLGQDSNINVAHDHFHASDYHTQQSESHEHLHHVKARTRLPAHLQPSMRSPHSDKELRDHAVKMQTKRLRANDNTAKSLLSGSYAPHVIEHYNLNKQGFDAVKKSVDDTPDLVKGGKEGSRGGHVIGHTGSGKPIYASHAGNFKGHTKGWSSEDHDDAVDAHAKQATKHFMARSASMRAAATSDKAAEKAYDRADAAPDRNSRDAFQREADKHEAAEEKHLATGQDHQRALDYHHDAMNVHDQHAGAALRAEDAKAGINRLTHYGSAMKQQFYQPPEQPKSSAADAAHGATYTSEHVKKSVTDNPDLVKGDKEGSRGGHVIGHTGSGHAIYAPKTPHPSTHGMHRRYEHEDHGAKSASQNSDTKEKHWKPSDHLHAAQAHSSVAHQHDEKAWSLPRGSKERDHHHAMANSHFGAKDFHGRVAAGQKRNMALKYAKKSATDNPDLVKGGEGSSGKSLLSGSYAPHVIGHYNLNKQG